MPGSQNLFHPQDREDLLRRVDALRADAQGQWGRMTVHQAVCHLSDGFRMVLGDRVLPSQGNFLLRTVVRFVALSTPMAWPKGSPTAPGLNQSEGGGTSPGDFQADVGALRELVDRFVATGGRGLHPHVAFGALRPGEWGRWAWRHMDHHLRQFGV